MAWILLRPSNYKQVAPLVRTGGSRHTGLAALPHRNIHMGIINNKEIFKMVEFLFFSIFIHFLIMFFLSPLQA